MASLRDAMRTSCGDLVGREDAVGLSPTCLMLGFGMLGSLRAGSLRAGSLRARAPACQGSCVPELLHAGAPNADNSTLWKFDSVR
ncbi:hypothetical protein GCM10009675_17780 [Prauserella alba]|uniref:Uncharacterized protein n=1 Tax=Prauserella alba TaxID=176898 RepID=A0ABN1VC37_9PSEU